jgi:hypothetical protein
VPAVEYPANAEWGPITWAILHGLAGRSGRNSNVLLQGDEIRNMILLIESVEKMIPCDICRGHYREYLVSRPVKGWMKEPYSALRENARKWFWTLHNEINLGNDKPVFLYNDLEATYENVNIRQKLAELSPPIQRAMTNSGVKLLHWLAFERVVKIMA